MHPIFEIQTFYGCDYFLNFSFDEFSLLILFAVSFLLSYNTHIWSPRRRWYKKVHLTKGTSNVRIVSFYFRTVSYCVRKLTVVILFLISDILHIASMWKSSFIINYTLPSKKPWHWYLHRDSEADHLCQSHGL